MATLLGDYECKTTFWGDFEIADWFGEKAILDTYKRASKEWASNVEYITELAMVLNHKAWQWAEGNNANDSYVRLYSDLYYKIFDWGLKNFKDADLKYFISTLD